MLEKLRESNLAGILHQPLQLFNLHLVRGPQFQHHSRRFVVFSVPSRALGRKVGERVEAQESVEFLLVDPVAPLDLAVVLGRPRPDEFVGDPVLEAESLQGVRAMPGDGGEALPPWRSPCRRTRTRYRSGWPWARSRRSRSLS